MLRYYLLLSLLVLAALLAGCAPKAASQPGEVRALENSTTTDVPEKNSTNPNRDTGNRAS